jgi:hypothetical protein
MLSVLVLNVLMLNVLVLTVVMLALCARKPTVNEPQTMSIFVDSKLKLIKLVLKQFNLGGFKTPFYNTFNSSGSQNIICNTMLIFVVILDI